MKHENRIVKLEDIAVVRTGVTNIDKVESGGAEYELIQLKDINDEGLLSYNLDRVEATNIRSSQLVRYNEIIFKAKSSQNVAAIMKTQGKYIATVHYFIIKIKNRNEVDADYLWWYLNQNKAKRHFEMMASGSSTVIVKKGDLECLEIIIPPLNEQKRIAEIYNLWLREKRLYKNKIDEKDKYIKSALLSRL